MRSTSGYVVNPQKLVGLLFISLACAGSYSVFADTADETYRFEITPYLWVATITGSASADGATSNSSAVDSDYSFFALDNLDGVASLDFSIHRAQWGFLFDFLYVAYEDKFLESTILEATPRLVGTIVEFAGSYAPEAIDNLDLVVGARQQNIEVSLKVLGGVSTANKIWTDPFVGAIYYLPLNEKFSMTFRGDLGGFGIESDMAVNFETVVRYQFNDMFSAKLGYRYLKVTFDEDSFVYGIGLSGFLFGLGIRF